MHPESPESRSNIIYDLTGQRGNLYKQRNGLIVINFHHNSKGQIRATNNLVIRFNLLRELDLQVKTPKKKLNHLHSSDRFNYSRVTLFSYLLSGSVPLVNETWKKERKLIRMMAVFPN